MVLGVTKRQSLVYNVTRALREYGVMGTLKRLYYYDSVKFGRLVGTDRYGNKFYEDEDDFSGMTRWIEYNPENGDYDNSMVQPEWNCWLAHQNDEPPMSPTHVPEPLKTVEGANIPKVLDTHEGGPQVRISRNVIFEENGQRRLFGRERKREIGSISGRQGGGILGWRANDSLRTDARETNGNEGE